LKFGTQVDIDECWRMRDRIPQKSMSLGSRDLFKFWEITDSISETAQDRDIVTTDY